MDPAFPFFKRLHAKLVISDTGGLRKQSDETANIPSAAFHE